jgi:sugar-specific transcriptional regulator TrmB
MIEKWIDVLKLFDLGEYESRTYAALVMNGPSTVKEIRRSAGVPYSREYDILESLEKRGFVKIRPGRPMVYSAVDPRKILKRECEIRINVVENLLDEIGPMYDKSLKNESPEESFWAIKGKRNVRDKLVEMINGSKEEILIVGVSPVSSDDVEKAVRASVGRGVTVKCLGEFDSRCKSLLEDIGAKVRIFEYDHSRYVLADGREALVAAEDPANAKFSIHTTSPGCIGIYQSYFKHVWEEAG